MFTLHYSHHIILSIFCCNEFHHWNISDFFCFFLSAGCMDDIITVLAEEHGCLDTVKVSLLVLMDSLSSLYFTFHTKIDLNLTVFLFFSKPFTAGQKSTQSVSQ